MSPGAVKQLQSCHWPGNVRELENLIERAMIKSRSAPLSIPLSFDEFLRPTGGQDDEKDKRISPLLELDTLPLNLDESNRRIIQAALKMTGGRVQGTKGAAAILGINPNTLRNRMKKLGIRYGRKSMHKESS